MYLFSVRDSSLMMSKSHWWLLPRSSLIAWGASPRLVSYIREPRGFSVDGRLCVERAAPRLPELWHKREIKNFIHEEDALIFYGVTY